MSHVYCLLVWRRRLIVRRILRGSARMFMRLMSDKIRLVVVDEPSSALDPRGEFELFETLRANQHGRTMVFVTHRFGHLTKHADVIL